MHFYYLIKYLEHYNSRRAVALVLQIGSAVYHAVRGLSLLSIARLDRQVGHQVRRRLLDLRRLAASRARRVSALMVRQHAC